MRKHELFQHPHYKRQNKRSQHNQRKPVTVGGRNAQAETKEVESNKNNMCYPEDNITTSNMIIKNETHSASTLTMENMELKQENNLSLTLTFSGTASRRCFLTMPVARILPPRRLPTCGETSSPPLDWAHLAL